MKTAVGKKVYLVGTHRARQPEETWEIVRPLLGQYGISRVADVTGLDTVGIPVAVAFRPLSRTLSVSQGKGHNLLLAKISAVMESIEMWHAEFAFPQPAYQSTAAAELDLPYPLEQLDHHTGSLLGPHTPQDWVTATSLLSGSKTSVPLDTVRLRIEAEPHWRPRGLRISSNGLASGNNHEEAALHALYEVMERDALSSLTQKLDDPRVNIAVDTIDDPVCGPLIEHITHNQVLLDVAFVPNRWGVPCFVAFVWSEDFPVLCAGSGAHSSTSVALSRAITEAVQSRLTAISGSRDDLNPMYSHVLRGSAKQPVIDPDTVTFQQAAASADLTFDDLGEELRWASAQVAELAGAEPLVCDLSTHEDFSVVKVICPGLNSSERHTIPRPLYEHKH
ncbi:YcaO-like family protein [Streptomyces sp. NPDC007094]|uniref:YcaO-like family protein n=1 Tax=Streptomyces sp. NPDC007094 TaxID=3155359 RepID=UPI0034108A8E